MFKSGLKDKSEHAGLFPQSVFSPYEVREVGFQEVRFWETYIQIKQSLTASRMLDGFDEYQQFIDRLRTSKGVRIVPLSELMSASRNSKVAALRFDVDIEPFAALRLARYNARFAIPSSFFLLHTAYYYGTLEESIFYRNPLLKDLLMAMIVAGCEIGLHTDALHWYLNHGIDGSQAIIEELNWLRSKGAYIKGTAAHNSFPAYNAENFEIFGVHSLGGRRGASKDGQYFPLAVLDEAALGLSYEANFPILPQKSHKSSIRGKLEEWCNATHSDSVESEKWMRVYLLDNPCFVRGFETIIWHHGGSQWTIATRANHLFGRHWYWKIETQKMFRVLDRLPDGTRLVFLLHPVYFSRDTNGFKLKDEPF